MNQYPIVEIFQSIQGEGYYMGTPTNFIRFAGCNLKCPWCDTKWDTANALMVESEIVAKLDFNLPMIVITGGEPFLQPLVSLLKAIREVNEDIVIAFETNGTRSTATICNAFENIWIACSPKPERKWQINNGCFYDELKYVIDDKISIADINTNCDFVWLQPQGFDMQNSWKKCLEIVKKDPHRLRVGVQLHKIMEVR